LSYDDLVTIVFFAFFRLSFANAVMATLQITFKPVYLLFCLIRRKVGEQAGPHQTQPISLIRFAIFPFAKN
jgi:hypothetical protein